MKDEELIEVLWSISLSENLGDVAEAIEPILKHFCDKCNVASSIA